MSVFTPREIDYLKSKTMGRLATVGRDGQPHLVPLTFQFNEQEDAIDIGGVDFPATKKWRNMRANRRATFLVDDASPEGAHAIEIRGTVETHSSGGDAINPRFPNFKPEFVRLRPGYIVSWSIEEAGFHPYGRSASKLKREAAATSAR
jgi:pyridoxamine 5'-phosphate oxidase family protein